MLFAGATGMAICHAIVAGIIARAGPDFENKAAGNAAVVFLYMFIAIFAVTWGMLLSFLDRHSHILMLIVPQVLSLGSSALKVSKRSDRGDEQITYLSHSSLPVEHARQGYEHFVRSQLAHELHRGNGHSCDD